MTAPAWAHLPNAVHIDRVLASLKAHPDKWEAAWIEAWGTARNDAWIEAWGTARNAAWDAARTAAQTAAWSASWTAERGAAWSAGGGAITALIAWDDCAYMLGLPEDTLKVLHAVGNQQALLLLGAAKVLRETS